MAAQFEAEIVNSMGKVGASVDRVAKSTDVAQKNMLAVGAAIDRCAKSTENASRQMFTFGTATAKAKDKVSELDAWIKQHEQHQKSLGLNSVHAMNKMEIGYRATGQSVSQVVRKTESLDKGTSVAAGNMTSQLAKAQAAASRFGGAMGGAVAQVGSLIALNPQMLAAGAVVGLLASQWDRVSAAVSEAVRRATSAAPTLSQISGDALAGARAGAGATLRGADLASLRAGLIRGPAASAEDSAAISYAVSNFGLTQGEASANLAAFRKSAPRAALTPEQRAQIAAGFGASTPEQFAEAQTGSVTDVRFMAARDAQLAARVDAAAATDRALLSAATGAAENRVMQISRELQRMNRQYNSADTVRQMESLQAELESYKAQSGLSGR